MKGIFIFVLIVLMVPLLFTSISEIGSNKEQELTGFSVRDIQYIESIGYVDIGNGVWQATASTTLIETIFYEFDYSPIYEAWNYKGVIQYMRVANFQSIQVVGFGGYTVSTVNATTKLYGGDVS